MPYYLLFAVFLVITLLLRYYVIEPQTTTLLSLVGYGLAVYPALLLTYFYILFVSTRGMKYFVARKPGLYRWLNGN